MNEGHVEDVARKPRGRAPAGKIWNQEVGVWEEDPLSGDGPSAANSTGARKEIPKSQYVGVQGSKHGKPGWVAKLSSTQEGKKVRKEFGPFDTEEEAARMYDTEASKLGRPVNFPAEGTYQKQASKAAASAFLGVCWHKPAKRWTAGITVNGRNKHLGYFPNEEEAARAYDYEAGPLGRKANFPETAPPPDQEKMRLNKEMRKSASRDSKRARKEATPADAAAALDLATAALTAGPAAPAPGDAPATFELPPPFGVLLAAPGPALPPTPPVLPEQAAPTEARHVAVV